MILHGVTVNVIRYGNQRIAVQHNYYAGDAILHLLSAPRYSQTFLASAPAILST